MTWLTKFNVLKNFSSKISESYIYIFIPSKFSLDWSFLNLGGLWGRILSQILKRQEKRDNMNFNEALHHFTTVVEELCLTSHKVVCNRLSKATTTTAATLCILFEFWLVNVKYIVVWSLILETSSQSVKNWKECLTILSY